MKRLIKLPKSKYTKEDFENSCQSDFEKELEDWWTTVLFEDIYEEFHKYGGD